ATLYLLSLYLRTRSFLASTLACSCVLYATATTQIYALSLHDALPIYGPELFPTGQRGRANGIISALGVIGGVVGLLVAGFLSERSEEHTSELQSRENLVCRLLLEKKKNKQQNCEANMCK